MNEPEAEARLAVCVILRKNDKMAFVLRSNTQWMNGHYGLIGGRVQPGETFTAAAVREAKEEAGVTVKPADLKVVLTVQRNHRDSDKEHWIDIFFEASHWEGEAYNAEPDVHGELAWLDPENLPKNILPMIGVALQQIANHKTYLEYGW